MYDPNWGIFKGFPGVLEPPTLKLAEDTAEYCSFVVQMGTVQGNVICP